MVMLPQYSVAVVDFEAQVDSKSDFPSPFLVYETDSPVQFC